MAIKGAIYDEIVRKAKAGESMVDPTPEKQEIYDAYASAYSPNSGSSNQKKNGSSPSVPNVSQYTSQYQKQINGLLSDLQNTQPFSYDPSNDPSYQAYVQQQQGLGQTAFNNQLGTMSAATGGRPNSWAQSIASQAQGAYNQQAASAMPQFQQQAYNEYQGNNNLVMDQLKFVMGLDEMAFGQYQTGIENQYAQYSAELQAWGNALSVKKEEIQKQYDRVKLMGYVDNEASISLGIPPGTASYEARLAAEERLNWIYEQDRQFEEKMYLMDIEQQQAKELIRYRESVSGTGTGSGSKVNKDSGGNSFGIKTSADARKLINKFNNPEDEEYGIRFAESTNDIDKYSMLADVVEEVLNDPSLNETRKEEILKYIYENTSIDELEEKFSSSYR